MVEAPAQTDGKRSEAAIVESVISLLQLGGADRFVEILGPHGSSWVRALIVDGALRSDSVVVTSPSAAARLVLPVAGVPLLAVDPLEFSESAETWDKVLVNQVLGYVSEPARMIANLAERLRLGGRLLVAELVPGPGDPLYEPALRRWCPARPHAAQIADWLRDAGLIVLMGRVERTRRFSDRLWELERELSAGDAATAGTDPEQLELRAALEELARSHGSRRSSEFTECFDLILGAAYQSDSPKDPQR